MATNDKDRLRETDELVERILRAELTDPARDGMTWEDLRTYAKDASTDEGIIWDDALLAALALRMDSERPVPPDVAERHLGAMHAALDESTTASMSTPRRGWLLGWRRRIAGAVAAATAFTTFGGGAAVAMAQEAEPGDTLYGVKRASEQARLLIELDPTGDAQLHLQFAQRRLDELSAAPDEADALLEDALEHLAHAERDGDETTVAQAEQAGERAVEALTALLDGKLPETASPQAREALERARDRKQEHIDARSDGATGRDQAPGQGNRPDDGEPGTSGETPASDAPGEPDDPPAKPDDTPGGRDDAPSSEPSEPGTDDGQHPSDQAPDTPGGARSNG